MSPSSHASIQARRNLDRILDSFDRSQIRCSICDLGREPLAGIEDGVSFTPTLVKRYPEPRMWLLGSLAESEILADLLRVCGVNPRHE